MMLYVVGKLFQSTTKNRVPPQFNPVLWYGPSLGYLLVSCYRLSSDCGSVKGLLPLLVIDLIVVGPAVVYIVTL